MKQVELHIEITDDGRIIAKPKGTQGSECLDLMAFLDTIEGFNTEETKKTDEYYQSESQTVSSKNTVKTKS